MTAAAARVSYPHSLSLPSVEAQVSSIIDLTGQNTPKAKASSTSSAKPYRRDRYGRIVYPLHPKEIRAHNRRLIGIHLAEQKLEQTYRNFFGKIDQYFNESWSTSGQNFKLKTFQRGRIEAVKGEHFGMSRGIFKIIKNEPSHELELPNHVVSGMLKSRRIHLLEAKKGEVGVALPYYSELSFDRTHYLATTLKVNVAGSEIIVPIWGLFQAINGNDCAEFLVNNLPQYIKDKLTLISEQTDSTIRRAQILNLLKTAFVYLGDQYQQEQAFKGAPQNDEISQPPSATATIMMLFQRNLWIATLGNGRVMTYLDDTPGQFNGGTSQNYDDIYKRGAFKQGNMIVKDQFKTTLSRQIGLNEVKTGVNPRSKVIRLGLDSHLAKYGYIILANHSLYSVGSSRQIVKTLSKNISTHNCEQMALIFARKAHQFSSNSAFMVVKLDGYIRHVPSALQTPVITYLPTLPIKMPKETQANKKSGRVLRSQDKKVVEQ